MITIYIISNKQEQVNNWNWQLRDLRSQPNMYSKAPSFTTSQWVHTRNTLENLQWKREVTMAKCVIKTGEHRGVSQVLGSVHLRAIKCSGDAMKRRNGNFTIFFTKNNTFLACLSSFYRNSIDVKSSKYITAIFFLLKLKLSGFFVVNVIQVMGHLLTSF